jgi:hypothetical protein
MSPDDIKKRIVNEIKARAYDDKYIDRNEEREIVRIAIELGVTVESALAALSQVCDEFGYALESRVVKGDRGASRHRGGQRRQDRPAGVRPDLRQREEGDQRQRRPTAR